MTTTSLQATARPLGVAAIGAIGGMVAGMMMAAVEMIYGWLSPGHSFWDAPMAIWAWVAGIDSFGDPGDNVDSIVLGMVGHMMISAMVGIVFAAAMVYVIRARSLVTSVAVGTAYGLLVWVGMRYVLLPLNAGEADLFTTDLVSPQWVWWLAHAVLGMTAGAFFVIARRVRSNQGG